MAVYIICTPINLKTVKLEAMQVDAEVANFVSKFMVSWQQTGRSSGGERPMGF